jgi:NitT/TauT family transport system permease protein
MGTYDAGRAAFEPMIGLLRYLPAPAFIPLLIIWLAAGQRRYLKGQLRLLGGT